MVTACLFTVWLFLAPQSVFEGVDSVPPETRKLVTAMLSDERIREAVDRAVESKHAASLAELEASFDPSSALVSLEARKSELSEIAAQVSRLLGRHLDPAQVRSDLLLFPPPIELTSDEIETLRASYEAGEAPPRGAKLLEEFTEQLDAYLVGLTQTVWDGMDARNAAAKTMEAMRAIGAAIEAQRKSGDSRDLPTLDELLARAPAEAGLMRHDRWGGELVLLFSEDGERYRVVSAGSDRDFERDSRTPPSSASGAVDRVLTDDFEADIIFADGAFIQLPKELRRLADADHE